MKPHLATDVDLRWVKYPVLALPKLDGVRGLHLPGSGLTARSLKKFKNRRLTEKLSHPDLEGLDGELLYVNKPTASDLCRSTTSLVNTIDGPDTAVWYLFDYLNQNTVHLPYRARYKLLTDKVLELCRYSDVWDNTLFIMPCLLIHTEEKLLATLQEYLSNGYEGIILRNPHGPHKDGRARAREANFLRIKDFVTEEAEITNIFEAQENLNEATTNELGRTTRSSHQANKTGKGMIGAFQCWNQKWGHFIVSSGKMSHTDRVKFFENPELIYGKHCTFKYLKTGSLNAPRMATFQHFRAEEDIL